MLNIVVPIAGRGSRFTAAGFVTPKPLIDVHGKPMIEVVIDNVRPSCAHRFIFLALEEHLEATPLRSVLRRAAPGCEIVPVAGVTEGAACTVLLARDLIDAADPLMIANTDQWVEVNIDRYLARMDSERADGLIMTMTAADPKWSFVGRDRRGRVDRVVEKQPVSSEATVGIYNFRDGRAFVSAADQMVAKDLRVNGEFYVAPVYNELIDGGATIATYNVGAVGAGMWGLGTPEDLAEFLSQQTVRA
jgi:dTDP-glucose pyrophosphorylase